MDRSRECCGKSVGINVSKGIQSALIDNFKGDEYVPSVLVSLEIPIQNGHRLETRGPAGSPLETTATRYVTRFF